MPIKQPVVLSRADFDQAVVSLRLNVSEIAKVVGIPRTYLSEFRNGDRKLRPEHQAKLRDFFEEKGVEFEDEPGDGDRGPRAPQPGTESPHPRVAVTEVLYLPIRVEIDEDRVRDVFTEIGRNDKRIAELSNRKVKRDGGEIAAGSQDEVRELFALLAANYVFVRYLTGTDSPLEKAPKKSTLQEVLLDTILESVERAGVRREESEEARAET